MPRYLYLFDRNALKILYEQRFTTSNKQVTSDTEFVLLFNTLLSILSISKNIILLRYVIYIRASTDRNHCDDVISQMLKTSLSE